jgi:hypothetical protein
VTDRESNSNPASTLDCPSSSIHKRRRRRRRRRRRWAPCGLPLAYSPRGTSYAAPASNPPRRPPPLVYCGGSTEPTGRPSRSLSLVLTSEAPDQTVSLGLGEAPPSAASTACCRTPPTRRGLPATW